MHDNFSLAERDSIWQAWQRLEYLAAKSGLAASQRLALALALERKRTVSLVTARALTLRAWLEGWNGHPWDSSEPRPAHEIAWDPPGPCLALGLGGAMRIQQDASAEDLSIIADGVDIYMAHHASPR